MTNRSRYSRETYLTRLEQWRAEYRQYQEELVELDELRTRTAYRTGYSDVATLLGPGDTSPASEPSQETTRSTSRAPTVIRRSLSKRNEDR
jgi:hypothetical protein